MSRYFPYLNKSIRSRSRRAGLFFPVGRIHRQMRKGRYALRIGAFAPVYFAGVLEYLCTEILETAGYIAIAKKNRKSTILPRHVMLAVKNDKELDALLKGVLLHGAGVKPHIEQVLVGNEDEEEEE